MSPATRSLSQSRGALFPGLPAEVLPQRVPVLPHPLVKLLNLSIHMHAASLKNGIHLFCRRWPLLWPTCRQDVPRPRASETAQIC